MKFQFNRKLLTKFLCKDNITIDRMSVEKIFTYITHKDYTYKLLINDYPIDDFAIQLIAMVLEQDVTNYKLTYSRNIVKELII